MVTAEKKTAGLVLDSFLSFRRAVGIAAVTTFVGLILPGLVAHEENIFDVDSLARYMMPKLQLDVRQKIERYRFVKASAEDKLFRIDSELTSARDLTNERVSTLMTQRTLAEKVINTAPPIVFLPFYLSSGMLLWVLTLTPVAWLAFLFFPGDHPFALLRARRVVSTALLAYVSYQWTVWMRYFVLGSTGRKVYAFANYDVSPAGFWVQELQTILFWLLLAIVCFQWLQHAEKMSRNAPKEDGTLRSVAESLSATFFRWQFASVLLACSFFPFTAFYWEQVVNVKDMRFLPAAIILHTMWAAAWLAISSPLFVAWAKWRSFKTALLQGNMTGPHGETVVKALEAAEPIGDWAKAISAALTALSFLGPLLKVIVR